MTVDLAPYAALRKALSRLTDDERRQALAALSQIRAGCLLDGAGPHAGSATLAAIRDVLADRGQQ